ncbi:MAG: hypothetical protein M3552_03315 [Planctomycetota bacterium]|nr:hypothetical protein [Planctomycetaceae bacterium]MDQ3329671.1 hypothetical protein [Planctomycetota bacterium]
MTTLLQKAIAAVEGLSTEEQDAIAARLLAEVEDERIWEQKFRKTTDDQWDRLAEQVRREVAEGLSRPLEDAFPADEPSP